MNRKRWDVRSFIFIEFNQHDIMYVLPIRSLLQLIKDGKRYIEFGDTRDIVYWSEKVEGIYEIKNFYEGVVYANSNERVSIHNPM